ncbi:MAG: hypothetical protein U5K00_14380 [Melioribacteraceae bacterium]|nr:hypothetical protein [Melioribacteraceae bacterium]
MSEMSIINSSIIILLLPLISFILLLFFGKRFPKLYIAGTAILFAGLGLSIAVTYSMLTSFSGETISYSFTWINFNNVPGIGPLTIDLGIEINSIAALMLIVVNLISALVHLYSIEYMHGDSRFTRYFAYLGIFHILNAWHCSHRQHFDDVHLLGISWTFFIFTYRILVRKRFCSRCR